MIRDINYSGNLTDEIPGALLLERRPDFAGDVDNSVDDLHSNVAIAQEVVELESIDQPRLEPRVKRMYHAVVSDN